MEVRADLVCENHPTNPPRVRANLVIDNGLLVIIGQTREGLTAS